MTLEDFRYVAVGAVMGLFTLVGMFAILINNISI